MEYRYKVGEWRLGPPKSQSGYRTIPLTDEEMAVMATLERGNRLVKGHVFLWEGAKDWHDLWDEEGFIVK